MGCNSSKSTKVDENTKIENEEQAAAEPTEQRPVFYTWGFSPFCRAVAMVAAELEIDLAHKVGILRSFSCLLTDCICRKSIC